MIELKELAPFLPYGLKMWHNKQGEIVELTKLNTKLKNDFSRFQPLVRPLSDLTKDIEHNGEKFVPYIALLKQCNFDVDKFDDAEQNRWKAHFSSEHIINNVDSWMFFEVQKLFEWHFDVFNWIEQDKAINLNEVI